MYKRQVFECLGGSGNTFNQFKNAGRIQANRFGPGSLLSISGSFTNGSGNIVVADATQFSNCLIGMPLAFTGTTPGGFNQNFTYYVSGRNEGTNTITLAAAPVSSSVVTSTATGTFTLSCGGFPGLEIHADSLSLFTNSDFGHLDIECSGNLTSISIRRIRTSKMRVAEMYASQAKNSITARDASGLVEFLNISNVGRADLDSASSALNFQYALGGVRNLTAGETLVSARHNCELRVNSASPVALTIPADMLPGFRFDVIQVGAGQVTISAPTLNCVNVGHTKTSGQHARITVAQTSSDVYNLSGNTAA